MIPLTREEQLLDNINNALQGNGIVELSPKEVTREEIYLNNIVNAILGEPLEVIYPLTHVEAMYDNIINAIKGEEMTDEPLLVREDRWLKAIADKFAGKDDIDVPERIILRIEEFYADILDNIPTGRLPAGYTELDYIESDGGQYIITDVIPSENDNKLRIITSVYQKQKTSGSSYPIMGATAGGRFCNINMSTEWHFVGGNTVTTELFQGLSDYPCELNTWYDIDATILRNDTNTSLVINGTSFASYGGNAYSTSPYRLFGTGAASSSFIGRMQETAFADPMTSEDIQRFVPCKNPSNEYGMYDLVTSTFYGNEGTGSFSGGMIE